MIEEALGYVEQGFPAIKFRIGTQSAWDGVTVDRFLSLVRELHQEVAGRMELALDGNFRLTMDDALPNLEILEVCQIQGPLQWGIAAEPPQMSGGLLHLPDRPGLGIEVTEDVAELYPYIEGHYALTIER